MLTKSKCHERFEHNERNERFERFERFEHNERLIIVRVEKIHI